MVIDSLKNAPKYYKMGKGIEVALKYLQENDLGKLESGNYEIDKSRLYYLVRHNPTKLIENNSWEAHRKYIDIHYIIEGYEYFGYSNIKNMKMKAYLDEKDKVELYGEGDFFKLQEGFFAICDLDDVHMPNVTISEPQSVKRVCVKVIID